MARKESVHQNAEPRVYTVMIVPDRSAKTRNFKVTRTKIKTVVSLVFIWFLLTLGMAGYIAFAPKGLDDSAEALLAENLKLKQSLAETGTKVALVEANLERIERFDRKLRAMTSYKDTARGLAVGPLSEAEMLAGNRQAVGGTNEALATMLTEKFGQLESLDLGKEINRLLQDTSKRESELAELSAFLEDQKQLLASTPAIWPVRGWVTSGFGYRSSPFTGSRKFHDGIDISNNRGTPIVAPADGKVIFNGTKDGYGNVVAISHGFGLTTRFAHLQQAKVKVGQTVKRGQIIALLGNSGRSTGPHLHYEVRVNGIPVNPRKYILE